VLRQLAATLAAEGHLAAAISAYHQALALRPDYANAHYNLGIALHETGQPEEALRSYRQALALQPAYPEAHTNLANVLLERGEVESAIAAYETALGHNPAHPAANNNIAMAWLLQGDYRRGWPQYEWRFQDGDGPALLFAHPPTPRWDGNPLPPGSRLILVGEQGLGDVLQFMRYLLPLRQRGISVSLCALPKLHGLIQASGIDPAPLTPAEAERLQEGCWLPLLSLPGHLGVSPANPLVTTPYIRTTDAHLQTWRERLAGEGGPLIGLNWQGNPDHERSNSRGRSLPLECFAPLARLEGVRFLSLQKGHGSEQLEHCSFRDRFVAQQELVDGAWDFLDSAAILACCDLVITSDTSVAHLAGGMGRPTWLLLKSVPEWRWGLAGDSSPWYPSLRLFRQRQRGDWNEVLERVAQALQEQLAETLAVPPIGPEALEEADPFALAALGCQRQEQGDPEQAIALYRRALALRPDFPEALTNLGLLLQQRGELDAAISCFRQALTGQPAETAAIHYNLGRALQESGDPLAAVEAYRASLNRRETSSHTHRNLGIALQELGDLEGAIAALHRAVALDPTDAEAGVSLAMACLLTGRFQEGWAHYNRRFDSPRWRHLLCVALSGPAWDGAALQPGQRLILVAEQGIGDTLQFMRYLLPLRQGGLDAALCADPKLHGLIRSSGIDADPLTPARAAALGPMPWLPLLSLPQRLGVNAANPLVSAAYIRTPEALIQRWRERLAGVARPLVGLHWQGRPDHETTLARGRSLPLETLAPIAALPGVSIVSLQKGAGAEQLAGCSFRDRFVPDQALIDVIWDFEETAAIVACCDLVITADSAIAHLAGGMGRPTWLLLKDVPEWRWGLGGDSSPWYPSLRLFRQRRRGDWDEVVERVAQALQERIESSERPEALIDRGNARLDQGDAAGALQAFAAGLSVRPDWAEAHACHGLALQGLGRQREAIAAYRRALELRPGFAEALSNLGQALEATGEPLEAIACYERALALEPACAGAIHYNLGRLHQEGGDLAAAISSYRAALERQPDHAKSLINLGLALQLQGDLAAAIACQRHALTLQSDAPEALINLGNALQESGELEAAVACYRQVLERHPEQPDANKNLGMALLAQGQYQEGWRRYAWRFREEQGGRLLCASPTVAPWDGEQPLAGETLVLVCEQGLGDTLQFMRYAPTLRQRGITCRFCAPPKLHGLLQASGIDPQPLSPEQVGEIRPERWLPLLSLPQVLAVSPEQPLQTTPYIRTTDQHLRRWGELLAQERRPIIGIHWQGNPEHERSNSRGRSFPLEQLAPLARLEGIRLVSLQKGPGAEQLEACSFCHQFVQAQPQIDAAWDFLDTAAIVAHCDLVISSDSAIAHLAAGMGRPTWLLLKAVPEWRWGLEGDTSFWYPTMRLFRQRQPEQWAETIERVARELERHDLACWRAAPEATPAVEPGPGQADLAYSRGCQRHRDGDLPGAIAGYQEAIRLRPDLAAAWSSLGNARKQQGELEEAIRAFRRALDLRSDDPDTCCNLGNSHLALGDLQSAIACFRQGLTTDEQHGLLHHNLGVALQEQGDLAAAIAAFERSLQIDPGFAESHGALAMAMLLSGNYHRGWQAYEWRFATLDNQHLLNAQPAIPRWDGSPLADGERLMLVSEQGFGDTLQFMRFGLALKARGIPYNLCTPNRLHRLIEASGLDDQPLTPEQGDQRTDGRWLPLLSLPGLLGVSPEQPLIQEPYLRVPDERRQHWKRILADQPRPIIAINWQGNPDHEQTTSRGRSLPLEAFAALTRITGLSLLSLQKGAGSEQLDTCSFRDRFVSCQEVVSDTWDFLETAAIIANCDLVISSDTAMAHLAGGLGHPTWLLLKAMPEWRWGLAGDRSFWYPSMRLFRQQSRGDWAEVMERVAAELRRTVLDGSDSCSAISTISPSCRFDMAITSRPSPSNQKALHGLVEPSHDADLPLTHLAIPTLTQYELLSRLCLNLLETDQETRIQAITILDNGGNLLQSEPGQRLSELAPRVRIITPAHNLGVAGSWNYFARHIGRCIISNDDAFFDHDAARAFEEAANRHRDSIILENDHPTQGFSTFLLNRPDQWLAMGGFDEVFNPAYFEDNDARRRLALANQPVIKVKLDGWQHTNSSTLTNSTKEYQRMHWCLFERNKAYYLKKWGGLPGSETYSNPFNSPVHNQEEQ